MRHAFYIQPHARTHAQHVRSIFAGRGMRGKRTASYTQDVCARSPKASHARHILDAAGGHLGVGALCFAGSQGVAG
eukprot:7141521-Pyramimonas_sp.AAC.1